MTVQVPLGNWLVPVAYSMFDLTRSGSRREPRPFEDYLCMWSAFNAIYVTVAAEETGQPFAWFEKTIDGVPDPDDVWGLKMPKVKIRSERKQIEATCALLPAQTRDRLIRHSGTRFFEQRVPSWRRRIEIDARGQKLNGVINVGRTISWEYPVWSPIDSAAYARYMANDAQATDAEKLTRQIAMLLYTVRNNLVHGGKRADDANDQEVVRNALPLLRIVVGYFLGQP